MAVMACVSLHHPHPLLSITKLKLPHSALITHNKLAAAPPPALSSKRNKLFVKRWRLYASPEEALPSDSAAPLETAQQIVAASDDGTATVISVLLFIAFAILSVLTIGVIYLGVTDFLEKREKEKFEKEEAAKKKSGKKGKVRARTGPRGFGQKINEDDDDPDAL